MGNETYNLVRHESDEDITSEPETLAGKKIGILDSAMTEVLRRFLRENKVEAEVVVYQDYEPLFADFDSSRTCRAGGRTGQEYWRHRRDSQDS